MTRRDRVRQLRRIQEVRTVQRLAAEMETARALAHLSGLEQDRADKVERVRSAQAAWSQTVSGGSIRLDATKAWFDEVERGESELVALGELCRAARSASEAATDELAASMGRAEVADVMSRAAQRRLTLKLQAVTLDDLADRALHARPAS